MNYILDELRKCGFGGFMARKPLTDLEAHVAGAIVRHDHPFGELISHKNSERLETEFIEKWVHPYYMNLSSFSEEFKEELRRVVPRLTPEIISQLLGDFDWRSRITGAYFAAIKRDIDFQDIIGVHFLKSEVCYAGVGYCAALASL